jgi:large repetitive protein
MALSAASAYGTAQQTLTVTVQQAPAITSANAATFTVGTQGSFSVTTTGSPAPAIASSGSLPSGVTLTDNGDGTATLAGTPATGTKGSYPITITAANGVQPGATQNFTLTVGNSPAAPVITSASAATFTVGTQGSFAVTTTGSPTAAISASSSPALPSGITFTDNGNGTATLAGTPAAAGSYHVTITASNGVSPDATQSFTLTVTGSQVAPQITSANAAAFAAGQPGTFTVTTTGSPTAAISASSSPALPSGLTLTDNGNGTATLAGTPKPGSQGSYVLTVTAGNSAGTATQALTLTVNSGLAITSAAAAAATAGQAFSFTVTTVGSPTPTLTRTGNLPTGITWTANTNGTATISGTAAVTTHGNYPMTITAKNSTGFTSQAFTLTVDVGPVFTSSASVTETAGTAFSYLVSTRGYPTATLSSGALPAGVSFADNGDGTGTLSGTGTAATSKVVITAASSGGTATQTVSLAVRAGKPGPLTPVPAFTSPAQTAAMAGLPLLFTVTTAGSPLTLASLTRSGTLPAGVTFLSLGNGTATLAGIPTSGGRYPVTFTAKNAAGTTTQVFVLDISAAPVITTGANVTATVGSAFTYTVKATGSPTPAMAESGLLPPGVTWVDNGNGTATLAGVPDLGGSYKLAVSAASMLGTATQAFALTVDQAPAITSAATATATHGTPFTFTFTSSGYPRANLGHVGSVPGLAFTNTGNGTLTLSGTPTRAGTYSVTITVKNSFGSDSQAFTLTVS